MSKSKKAKSERTHPLVHNRTVTRRDQQRGKVPATTETATTETQMDQVPEVAEETVPEATVEAATEALTETTPETTNEAAVEQAEVWEQIHETAAEPATSEAPAEQPPADATVAEASEPVPETQAEQISVTEAATETPTEQASTEIPPEPKTPKKAANKPKTGDSPKKLSCLDAAAQVLQAAGKPLGCGDMIEEMSRQGLWSSPNGATPAATLYSAILREMKKGAESRFTKADRGKFAFTQKAS